MRPEILEARVVAGGFDILLKTRVAEMAADRAFIGNIIWPLPGVRESHTCAVMDEVKNSTLLAVWRAIASGSRHGWVPNRSSATPGLSPAR